MQFTVGEISDCSVFAAECPTLPHCTSGNSVRDELFYVTIRSYMKGGGCFLNPKKTPHFERQRSILSLF